MISLPKLNLSHGITLDLIGGHGLFKGIGSVAIDGVPLRSAKRPMFVDIRNPSAIQLDNYSLIDCHQTPEKTLLRFAMQRSDKGPMEWMVHEIRARYNTSDWSREPEAATDTELSLELRPVRRLIAGTEYFGFSYQYHYQSESIPIYKILDRGTWEIGGSAIGNEFWMRNCFVPSLMRMESKEQFYSTEWYIPDCLNPSALQFLSLQTELQGFTFTASESGILATWVTEPAHMRSLFEKPRGESVIAHLHEHCGDLAHSFSTSPVEVLWSAGTRDRVELINAYEGVRELVHESLHKAAGLRRERITTYGQIEEWGPADLERYRTLGLPKLLAAGIKTVYLANHFENNMNTWGVSNFCCTVDYKVAESVGEDNLRNFCRDANAAGAIVKMWANTALSTLTVMFAKRNGVSDRIRFLPEQDSIMSAISLDSGFVRNPSNAIEADHYTPVFAVLNLRDPAVRAYWLRRWKAAHDDIGLGAIFLDSSCNLSSDKFHYVQNTQAHLTGATSDQVHLGGVYRPAKEPAAAILTQYHAHLSLIAEMQQIGYVYGNEDIGVFGIHRHGPSLAMRFDSMFLWTDCIAGFDPVAIRKAGRDADDIFFRGLAYRMMWTVHWDIRKDMLSFHYAGVRHEDDVPGPSHLELLRVYNEVQHFMLERTVLPEETGVVYSSPTQQVLWAFQDVIVPIHEDEIVTDILTRNTLSAAREFRATARHVYLISSPDTAKPE